MNTANVFGENATKAIRRLQFHAEQMQACTFFRYLSGNQNVSYEVDVTKHFCCTVVQCEFDTWYNEHILDIEAIRVALSLFFFHSIDWIGSSSPYLFRLRCMQYYSECIYVFPKCKQRKKPHLEFVFNNISLLQSPNGQSLNRTIAALVHI